MQETRPVKYDAKGQVVESFVDRVAPRHGSPITFSHPNVQGGKALQIYGVNEILWGYRLITSVKATYGGQVIQVLGTYIDALQVTGNSRSTAELERIRRWFVDYMRSAGTGRRNQGYVTLRYPERGWELAIMPTNFGPWQIATDMVANEWAMQAEVVQPESNSLTTHTMAQYTKPLTDPTFMAIAFDPNNPAINPLAPANTIAQFDNIGDNFDRLLSAMTTGNYGTYGFDPLRDSEDQFGATADEQYAAAWGTEYLVEPSNSSSGSSGGSSGGEPSGKYQIINNIVAEFESRDMPGRLGVAVALLESNFLPDNWNGNYLGVFQTAPASEGGKTVSKEHTPHLQAAFDAARKTGKTSLLPEGTITKHYPASEQIFDAAEWFKLAANGSPSRNKNQRDAQVLMAWAMQAQGVNLDNNPLFGQIPSRFLPEADKLIKAAKSAGGGGSATISGMSTDQAALKKAITEHERFRGFDPGISLNGLQTITLQGCLAIMNAGWDVHLSSTLRATDSDSLHSKGLALDMNNYGPAGAARNSGGTSSSNPANFVAFLQANKGADKLGNFEIGGGANAAESRAWGTDFADKNNHVHIEWNV